MSQDRLPAKLSPIFSNGPKWSLVGRLADSIKLAGHPAYSTAERCGSDTSPLPATTPDFGDEPPILTSTTASTLISTQRSPLRPRNDCSGADTPTSPLLPTKATPIRSRTDIEAAEALAWLACGSGSDGAVDGNEQDDEPVDPPGPGSGSEDEAAVPRRGSHRATAAAAARTRANGAWAAVPPAARSAEAALVRTCSAPTGGVREGSGDPRQPKTYSLASRVGQAAQAILEYVAAHEASYLATGARGVPERVLRQQFGNNPDTSKALRCLVGEGDLERGGRGGRKDPFSYVVSRSPQTGGRAGGCSSPRGAAVAESCAAESSQGPPPSRPGSRSSGSLAAPARAASMPVTLQRQGVEGSSSTLGGAPEGYEGCGARLLSTQRAWSGAIRCKDVAGDDDELDEEEERLWVALRNVKRRRRTASSGALTDGARTQSGGASTVPDDVARLVALSYRGPDGQGSHAARGQGPSVAQADSCHLGLTHAGSLLDRPPPSQQRPTTAAAAAAALYAAGFAGPHPGGLTGHWTAGALAHAGREQEALTLASFPPAAAAALGLYGGPGGAAPGYALAAAAPRNALAAAEYAARHQATVGAYLAALSKQREHQQSEFQQQVASTAAAWLQGAAAAAAAASSSQGVAPCAASACDTTLGVSGLSPSLMHGAGGNDMLTMLPTTSCDIGNLGQLHGGAGPRNVGSPLKGAPLHASRQAHPASAADQAMPGPDTSADQVWDTDAGVGSGRQGPPSSALTYYWQLSSAQRMGAVLGPPAIPRQGAAPAPAQHSLC